MKKKIIFILGIIISIAIVTIITIAAINTFNNTPNYKSIEIADIINNNSDLPVKYMSQSYNSITNIQDYDKLNNYMSVDFRNKDISFSYYGYPNDESDYYLGEIKLYNSKYNILGVKVDDNMKQAISKIEKYGFTLNEKSNSYVATLTYKDFTIKLEANIQNYDSNEDNLTIANIQLNAKSEYLGNRIY